MRDISDIIENRMKTLNIDGPCKLNSRYKKNQESALCGAWRHSNVIGMLECQLEE